MSQISMHMLTRAALDGLEGKEKHMADVETATSTWLDRLIMDGGNVPL